MLKSFLQSAVLAVAMFAASADGAVVINQILSPGDYPGGESSPGYLSQRFTDPAYTYANSVLVDDFTVTAATLDLTSITAVVDGFGFTFKSLSDVTGWEVAVYSSLNAAETNITGNVFDATLSPSAVTVSGTFANNGDNNALLTLPVNILLPAAGTYYLGIIGVNSILNNGEIAVYTGGLTGGGNSYDMSPGQSTTSTALTKDAAYEIIGGPASAVPEPSTWALISLGASLLAVALRRRVGCWMP